MEGGLLREAEHPLPDAYCWLAGKEGIRGPIYPLRDSIGYLTPPIPYQPALRKDSVFDLPLKVHSGREACLLLASSHRVADDLEAEKSLRNLGPC